MFIQHRKSIIITTVFAIIFTTSFLNPAFGGSTNYRNVYVWSGSVSTPEGYFMLIRKENNACAVRFNKFDSSGSVSVPNTNVYILNIDVPYDYFYQADGTGDFKKKNVDSKHLKLSIKGASGSGAMVAADGNLIKCGPLDLHWEGESQGVTMYQGSEPHDEGIELAPTRWRDINEININDPTIYWYGYDATRKLLKIPVEELW